MKYSHLLLIYHFSRSINVYYAFDAIVVVVKKKENQSNCSQVNLAFQFANFFFYIYFASVHLMFLNKLLLLCFPGHQFLICASGKKQPLYW